MFAELLWAAEVNNIWVKNNTNNTKWKYNIYWTKNDYLSEFGLKTVDDQL